MATRERKPQENSPSSIGTDFHFVNPRSLQSSEVEALFLNVLSTYPSEAHIVCKCQLSGSYSEKDWIGLFKVGWGEPDEDCLSKAEIKEEEGNIISAFFMGSNLPTDSTEFYQFCYVSTGSLVKGASTPFRFKSNQSEDFVAEIDDDDSEALVVSSKRVALENELASMKLEHRTLKAHAEEVSRTLVNRTQELEKDLEATRQKLANTKATSMRLTEEHEQLKKAMSQKESRLTDQLDHSMKLETALKSTQARLLNSERENRELLEKINYLDQELNIARNQADASKEAIRMHSDEHKMLMQKQEEDSTLISYLKRHVEESAIQLKEVTEHETVLSEHLRQTQQQVTDAEAAFRLEQEALAKCRADLDKVNGEKKELEQIIVTLREQLAKFVGAQAEPDQLKLLQARHQSLETAYGSIRQQYLLAEERERKCKARYADMIKLNKSFMEREEKFHTRVLDLERRLRQGAEEYKRLARKFRDYQAKSLLIKSNDLSDDPEVFHDAECEILPVLDYGRASFESELDDGIFRPPPLEMPSMGKVAADAGVRTCLMCPHRFPANCSTESMENHVNSHFTDQPPPASHEDDGIYRPPVEAAAEIVRNAALSSCIICSHEFPGDCTQEDKEQHINSHFTDT